MYFWYKFLTYLFYPISSIFLLLRKIRNKEHHLRYKEKLSKITIPREKGFLLWCHVASVGEAMSILPLIENFNKDEKINKILITTITLSSAQILQKKYCQNSKIIHQFLPFDIPRFVNKFLDHWSPDLSIFIDSEIWPNLIFYIKEKKIPLLLVNGRITKKTFLRWLFVKQFAKKVFEKFDLCLVSNKETEDHLKTLGAKNIKNFGNLKFTKTKDNSNKNLDSNFLDKIKSRKIWCGSSTHDPEEIFCAKTHINLKKKHKNILTIIIPRHINRVKAISDELSKLNLNTVLFSELNKINDDTDILLVDAYGEALKLYHISNCVFLGKSLIKSIKNDSGQNPIEAARLGCKIFHGPYVSNFSEVYSFLENLGAANKVKTPEELEQLLEKKLQDNSPKNNQVIEKITNYGQSTLNNVLREIKIYIDK